MTILEQDKIAFDTSDPHFDARNLNGLSRFFTMSLSFIALIMLVTSAIMLVISIQEKTTSFLGDHILTVTIILTSAIISKLIFNRHPRHAVAWILLIMSLIFSTRLIAGVTISLYIVEWANFTNPVMMFFGWTMLWTWLPQVLFPPLFIALYFPSGKLLSHRWRFVVMAAATGIFLGTVGVAIQPQEIEGVTNPLVIPGALTIANILGAISSFLLTPVMFLTIRSIILRYRRADSIERKRMMWVLYPVGLVLVWWNILTPLIAYFDPVLWQEIESLLGFASFWFVSLAIPLTIGIAILRYDLFDIEIVINRTLVYSLLSALIIVLYILFVSIFGILIEAQTSVLSGLLATGIIAVIFQPLREHLQTIVDRVLYGERDDPALILSRLTQHLETTDTRSAILPNLVQTIASTMKIPYVAIVIERENDNMEVITEWGKAPEQREMISLVYQTRTIGYLMVAPRSPGERFTSNERMLLNTIAALTATTVRSTELSDELRQSRLRIVTAREEERRRIRRDLHDGLGPRLASQTLALEAISQHMQTNPEKAQSILESLQMQSHDAILDVRRLVYDLRPPALDDLGLVGALKQSAMRYESATLHFKFEVSDMQDDLPAAVETAVFRIAQEAMTNVVRHSGASHCVLRLYCDEHDMIVEIEDDGKGLQHDYQSGVGLQAMRERAAELNGQTRIESLPEGGCLIQARFSLEVYRE